MTAYLRAIACHLPEGRRTNEELAAINPSWDAQTIFTKTGIRARAAAGPDETAADLAYGAARKLLEQPSIDPGSIDVLLFGTQTADYLMPASACLLQERLGLPASCAAFDFNLGCSSYTYGLWLAKALIDSGSARNVLLLIGDTLAKYCSPHDMMTATIFGDAAAASLITADAQAALGVIGPTVLGTDGRGGPMLYVPAGGARKRRADPQAAASPGEAARARTEDDLFMNGPGVFSFTLSRVCQAVDDLLKRAGLSIHDVDHFLFHQANRFMLEQLRTKMSIPPERMPIDLEDVGNTAGASLPILIARCCQRGVLRSGHRCVLAGFGVGFSWAVTLLDWR